MVLDQCYILTNAKLVSHGFVGFYAHNLLENDGRRSIVLAYFFSSPHLLFGLVRMRNLYFSEM